MEHVGNTEKRQHGRHRPEQLSCSLGRVVDLSLGGMRVLSKREYHDAVEVKIDTARLGRLGLRGRVKWRRQLGRREHVLGITFESVSEADLSVLKDLMQEIADGVNQSAARRVGGKHWWLGVATAKIGVGLVALGGAMETHGSWSAQWLPGYAELIAEFSPYLRWGGLLGGGLLVLTGLSEMLRRSTAKGYRASSGGAGMTKQGRRQAQRRSVQLSRMEESHHLLNCILESSLGGVGVLKAVREDGPDTAITDFEVQLVNSAAEDLLGKNEVMLVGKRLSQAIPCLMKHTIFNDMTASVSTGLPVQKQYRMDDGRWIQLAVVQLGDGLAVTFADTTDQHHAQARLRHVAYHDELTGLPNRKLLMEHLGDALSRSKQIKGRKFAVLFLDFDRFKIVNDTLGHDVGDQLLNSISERLRENIRDVDAAAVADQSQIPARLGGDEFVVMLDGIHGEADAVAVADRLLAAFNEPHLLGDHRVVSTASIGIVVSNDSYHTVDELIRDADTAMYEAKNTGKAKYVVFDRQMHETLVAQSKLEQDLREAVANEDFMLVYEPIIDLSSGHVSGFEALIRWEHAERGVVLPSDFIPLAEELNIIGPVGAWVLKNSCEQLARWRAMGKEDIFLNVNLSRAQLYDDNLVTLVREQIERHGLDPAKLTLEVTETMVMDDATVMAEKLREIKKLGVRLALDDFGTGHSSLNVLQVLPLDILKIDRTFIANAGDAVRRYGAIIATITELAKNLDMEVVAEGIERQEQVALLKGLVCDYAQGWLFSRALDADGAAAMVADRKVFSVAA